MHASAPALFSVVRITSFLTCVLVALGSGTNYVFSAYGPQLSARLHLSHTQLNVIGLSGNVGVYGTAPLWGRIVDTRGPRILLVVAFVCLIVGYSGIRYFYDAGLADGVTHLSVFAFCLLVLCSFLSGIGGNGGLSSAMNSTARSFPDKARATTNGIVLSGFGLSAFLFSTIAHIVFPGDTSSFLLVLAVGTSIPMALGFFLVRPIPLPLSEVTHVEQALIEDEDDVPARVSSPILFQRENNSHTHLLSPHHHHHVDDEDEGQELLLEEEVPVSHMHQDSVSSDYVVPVLAGSVPLSPTNSQSYQRSRSSFSVPRRRARAASDHEIRALDGLLNIHGKGLFASRDFWLLFTITALLSGTGLMYINNVGSISQALFAKGSPEYDDVKAAQWQATQVSVISVMNCLGRISIGILADFIKTYLQLPRSFCITLVAALFVFSQLMCYTVDDVSNLWKTSAVLGAAYGCLFGLFPTITIEWFGLPHFSENWGFVSLSPMIGSNVLSIAFGRNLDAHVPESEARLNGTIVSTTLSKASSTVSSVLHRADFPSSHQCLDGRTCYIDTLKLTIGACCLGLALAVYAGWRDRQRQKQYGLCSVDPVPEIIWTEEEG